MTEANLVELSVLRRLPGHGNPVVADHGPGWTYRGAEAMPAYGARGGGGDPPRFTPLPRGTRRL